MKALPLQQAASSSSPQQTSFRRLHKERGFVNSILQFLLLLGKLALMPLFKE